jgi:hypothetical protein
MLVHEVHGSALACMRRQKFTAEVNFCGALEDDDVQDNALSSHRYCHHHPCSYAYTWRPPLQPGVLPLVRLIPPSAAASDVPRKLGKGMYDVSGRERDSSTAAALKCCQQHR